MIPQLGTLIPGTPRISKHMTQSSRKTKLDVPCAGQQLQFEYINDRSGCSTKKVEARYLFWKEGYGFYLSAHDLSGSKIREYPVNWMHDIVDAETGEYFRHYPAWIMSMGQFDMFKVGIQPCRWYKIGLNVTIMAYLTRLSGNLPEGGKNLIIGAITERMTTGSRAPHDSSEIQDCIDAALYFRPTLADVKEEISLRGRSLSKKQRHNLAEHIDKCVEIAGLSLKVENEADRIRIILDLTVS